MHFRYLAVLLPVLLGLAASLGTAGAQPPPSPTATAIRSALASWTSAFNARDTAHVCDVFAPDLRYDAGPILNGTYSGLCDRLRHLISNPEPTFRYALDRINDIITAGNLAVVRLDWTLTATPAQGPPETSHEAGMDIFRRQPDGSWKIVRFMAYNAESQTRKQGRTVLP